MWRLGFENRIAGSRKRTSIRIILLTFHSFSSKASVAQHALVVEYHETTAKATDAALCSEQCIAKEFIAQWAFVVHRAIRMQHCVVSDASGGQLLRFDAFATTVMTATYVLAADHFVFHAEPQDPVAAERCFQLSLSPSSADWSCCQKCCQNIFSDRSCRSCSSCRGCRNCGARIRTCGDRVHTTRPCQSLSRRQPRQATEVPLAHGIIAGCECRTQLASQNL